MNDLNGKIDAVVDGGACDVGVESTVITLATDIPTVLRPGGVTVEQLRGALGKVAVDSAVLHKLEEGRAAASPGMKYKHYAPKANVVLLKCTDEEFIGYVSERGGRGVAALCCDEDVEALRGVKTVSLGKRGDYEQNDGHGAPPPGNPLGRRNVGFGRRLRNQETSRRRARQKIRRRA